jgi:hypothetical protein
LFACCELQSAAVPKQPTHVLLDDDTEESESDNNENQNIVNDEKTHDSISL